MIAAASLPSKALFSLGSYLERTISVRMKTDELVVTRKNKQDIIAYLNFLQANEMHDDCSVSTEHTSLHRFDPSFGLSVSMGRFYYQFDREADAVEFMEALELAVQKAKDENPDLTIGAIFQKINNEKAYQEFLDAQS